MADPQRPQTVSGMHPQTAMSLGVLLQRLAASPKHRGQILKAVKEISPGYQLPADVAIENLKTDLKAERDAEKLAEQQQRAKNRRDQARKKMVDSHGEDTVKAIEEGVLKKYPHLEWEDAARLHAAEDGPLQLNSQPPQAMHGQIWEFPVPEGVSGEDFIRDPAKTANNVAHATIAQLRGGRLPR